MRKSRFVVCLIVCMVALVGTECWCEGPSVEVHGYILNRLYTNPSMSTRFVTERISISTIAKLSEDATVYTEIYYHPWVTDRVLGQAPNQYTAEQGRVYFESAYVDLPLGSGRIRIGKGRQLNFGITPSYPNRRTSQYGIFAETFTQDRIQGFQWYAKKGYVDGGLSFFTDQNLGTRSIGECAGAVAGIDTQSHICDRDNSANNSGRMAVSAKIGMTKPNFQWHISGCVGRLNPNQLGPVQPFVPAGVTNTDTTHNKFAADVVWNSGPFFVQCEWAKGRFSLLGITGYQISVGWQPKGKPSYVIKWAALNNDKPPTDNPITWNVQQLTLGYVHPIRKNVWLEINYEKNMTSNPTGYADPDNDILLWEIFSGF
ncbi:MAG: hypothetical protein QHI38_06335 [Armatimonadota bacterium]|nr:hypothetical protein [Armatimonadota bacterium]